MESSGENGMGENILDKIKAIRAKNNVLWMDLLNIAMKLSCEQYASMLKDRERMNDITMNRLRSSLAIDPEQAKKILAAINANDKKISELVGTIK
jgi:hypothetical protein